MNEIKHLVTLCDCHHEIRYTARKLKAILDPEYPGYQTIYENLQHIKERGERK